MQTGKRESLIFFQVEAFHSRLGLLSPLEVTEPLLIVPVKQNGGRHLYKFYTVSHNSREKEII